MGSIHTFMAGINDYPAAIASPLEGCLNDVAEAHRLLTDRTGGGAQVRTVLDGAATVAAVEDGISGFLGAAGPGDTALFWFSGHGTSLPATGADLLTESTGFSQALVCADGPLPDKRLGALLDAVAARGAQVVAVLDCCYSGGATRDDLPEGLTPRFAPPRPEWERAAPVTREVVLPQSPARHVLLAACRLDQLSYEGDYGGRRHGAFTYALLGAVRTAGPDATYRHLLSAAHARVRRSGGLQLPVLYPETPGGTADLPFLGGALARSAGEHLLRNAAEGWEVDCGSGHGLADGKGAEGTEFSVAGPRGALLGAVVRARSVRPDRTLVDPVGWAPDPDQVYPVNLTALATPPATVSVPEGAAGDLLRAAVAAHGPGGGPAPLLSLVDEPGEFADLHFRVVVDGGRARVLGRDGTDFVDPLPFTAQDDAWRVADCLTHLTRWHQLRDLTSRPGVLDNLVQVEVVPWDAPGSGPLLPDGSGDLVCAYAPEAAEGRREPLVSIRLHNRSPHRSLWCVLLDLTDHDYSADPALVPGEFIGPGCTGYALEGGPVQLSLPAGRPVVPGAECRDWLKLIVAEDELRTTSFRLPAWDPERVVSRSPGPGAWGGLRFEGHRDRKAGPVRGYAAGRWATRTVALRTVVPATGRGA
ncbi:caspase domain-containing protein [Streptomyces sp. NPDC089424]|uniref:caspase family protein n=1 Tax=Streptomyces sp. NPDC089424 TaxID=3365917 RepID=UPI00382BC56D